ncbi:MAG: hypothetical protein JWM21_4000 [Acidobacteria bacterium]|nr:hypothetical protein [Acidobacteriota bacterium]
MILPLLLALLLTAGGALATYIYDEDCPVAARLCTGACIGLAAFGLIGFMLASLLGLTPLSIGLATLVTISPCALLLDPFYRVQIRADLELASQKIRQAIARPSRADLGYFLYYAIAAILFGLIFDRAMIQKPDGIYTGVLNNFGDLPFHLSVITGFAYGHNYPPEDPTFAGVRFTYPFLTDFISAVFLRCGASLSNSVFIENLVVRWPFLRPLVFCSLRNSMFIENFLLAIGFMGVLHRWAWEMLRDRVAALLTPLLVVLNGGFGWALLVTFAGKNDQGLFGVLAHLPASFTVIPETTWRWGNAISSLLVPQRGILLGLPLAVIVFTQWWLATGERTDTEKGRHGDTAQGAPKKLWGARKLKDKNETGERRPSTAIFKNSPTARMVAAGVAAGLLPLVHAHSFVVVMAVGAGIALLQRRWRLWITFAVVASLIAVPQMLWSTTGSAVKASSFFAWEFGWDHGQENPVWFWFKNTGLFIPLLIAAILWRGKDYLVSRRLLHFYLPFTLCFIVPNMVKLAPWIWDNVKVLFYWWVASAPLVALLLSRLWHEGQVKRAIAVALFVCLTLAGALDVASIVMRSGEFQLFDPNGVRFAEVVKEQTQPRSTVIHAPIHNTPVFLTGRRSLMGYPGHIWTHGIDFGPRESEIKRIYSGAPDAELLLGKYGVDYAVVGPNERLVMPVNNEFFSRFKKVGEAGEYRLYKIKP